MIPVAVAHSHMFETVSEEQFGDGNAGRTGTVYNDFTVFFFLAGDTQTVDDTGKDNDGSSMLVIMEYRECRALPLNVPQSQNSAERRCPQD